MNKKDKQTRSIIPLPLPIYITICALPAVLTILFYIFRTNVEIMHWVSTRISAPVRRVLGLFSSIYPFSLMEVAFVIAGVFVIYYIVRTITVTTRRREKLKILLNRVVIFISAILYVWSLFCWLWNSGYHAPGFAELNGFSKDGISADNLVTVARFFAEKANELAPLVKRDEEGFYNEEQRDFFSASTQVYDNLVIEFPSLEGRLFKPKSMMFSWLMSRTGYTGIYFALTGESSINTDAPAFLMPATIAHELAHQKGIASEDEANFVGIMACVTSGNIAYEYSGYMMGLIYLRNALSQPTNMLSSGPSLAWYEINESLCDEVIRDLNENSAFWQSQKTVETGVEFLDTVLTTVTETVSNTVDTVYDGYLRSQSQELGLRSYGACVDLLVEYYVNSEFGIVTNEK